MAAETQLDDDFFYKAVKFLQFLYPPLIFLGAVISACIRYKIRHGAGLITITS